MSSASYVRKYENEKQLVAIIINPKTREPVSVYRERKRSIELYYPGDYVEDSLIGDAYWDADEYFELGEEEEEYKRSQSPDPGVPQGMGFGVCLYTGLALRAFADTSAHGVGSTGDSACEKGSRSGDADRFWERAVKSGLAKEGKIQLEFEDSITVGADQVINDCNDLEIFTSDAESCTSLIHASGKFTVDFERIGEPCEFQYISGEVVADKGLILVHGSGRAFPAYQPPSLGILMTLNLENCKDPVLADYIVALAMEDGLEEIEGGNLWAQRLLESLPEDVYEQTNTSKLIEMEYTPNKREALRIEKNMASQADLLWESVYGDLAAIDD